MDQLISAYKGELINLLMDERESEQIKSSSQSFTEVTLSQRQICDLELIVTGGLSPLTGFMSQRDYDSVLENTTLSNGTIWPIPYYLDISKTQAENINIGDSLALLDPEGFMSAVMTVESLWKPDKRKEAECIYGTVDNAHPGVNYLFNTVGDIYVGGRVSALQLQTHYDFEELRFTPRELRQHFDRLGWKSVVAFHTSKPMHSVHYEMTMRASIQANAHILIHPVVGMSNPGDLHYHSRVHCYEAILKEYPKNLVTLALIPMAMRMAGPREALMNAIIRQNYGCTHYIVGTEHAAPPDVRENSKRYYDTGAAQRYLQQYKNDIDIEIISIDELCYDKYKNKYVIRSREVSSHCEVYSNTRILNALSTEQEIPKWCSYSSVLNILRKAYPIRSKQGLTLFFTGLSGSGKSTLAKIIYAKFIEEGKRAVTLLDGDVVRKNLSSELGFSKSHRNINVRRIGYVASEIAKNRGVAICAPIAPYRDIRREVRERIEEYGAFIEIHVATSLEVCEKRDRKGLYAKARQGIIPEFTGISDPYDEPERPEIRIDTENISSAQASQEIYLYLISHGYIK